MIKQARRYKCEIENARQVVTVKLVASNQTTWTLQYKDLVVFLVGFFGEEPGLLELVFERIHALLISQRPVLEHLAGAAPYNDTLVPTPQQAN